MTPAPDFPDGQDRTFVHLATHTSGIRDTDAGYEEAGYHFGATSHPVPLADFLVSYLTEGGALHDPQANFGTWAPGSRYEYSNIGAGLAGLAIQGAVGVDFATYSAGVLAPLEMSAGWGHLGPAGDAAATLYEWGETGAFTALPPYGLATWPDGQYTASAHDLARLLATVMADGRFGDRQLLAPEVVARLTTPLVRGLDGMEDPDDWVGLFWGHENLSFGPWHFSVDGHSGGDPGVFTLMYHQPGGDRGFVLMMNGGRESVWGLTRLARIANLLATMPGGTDQANGSSG